MPDAKQFTETTEQSFEVVLTPTPGDQPSYLNWIYLL